MESSHVAAAIHLHRRYDWRMESSHVGAAIHLRHHPFKLSRGPAPQAWGPGSAGMVVPQMDGSSDVAALHTPAETVVPQTEGSGQVSALTLRGSAPTRLFSIHEPTARPQRGRWGSRAASGGARLPTPRGRAL